MRTYSTSNFRHLAMSAVALLAAGASLSLSAEIVTVGDFNYDVDPATNTAAVAAYVGFYPDLQLPPNAEIPATIAYNDAQVPVTSIAPFACSGAWINVLTLGENIETIGNNAFGAALAIKQLVLNEGLKTIGQEAFYNCQRMSDINFPSTLEVIGEHAFYNCLNLKSINLNEGLKEIGNFAFRGTGLSGVITIPSTVEVIGDAPFRSLTAVTGFEVAEGSDYFCSSDDIIFTKDMTGLVCYPAGKNVPAYEVPAGVKYIANQAMRNNISLSSVKLPEGLERIGDLAFVSDFLTEFNVPASVTYIGEGALFNNVYLTSITVDPANTEYRASDGMLFGINNGMLVAVVPPKGDVTIPEGVKILGGYTFYNNPNLGKVTLPSTLERIGDEAFEYSSITEINFPASLKSVGMQAFASCANLREAMFEEGLEEIGQVCFFLSGVQRASLPGTLKNMGYGIFSNCSNLNDVTLGEGITVVPESMFNQCWNLEAISIPSTVEVIEQYAMYGAAFPYIELPEGLKSIGEGALYGTGLETLTIPDSVEEIGTFGCAWNFVLKDVKIGKGLKTLGNYAFHLCSQLEKIELNEGLEWIGEAAISNSDALLNLTIPSTVDYLGPNTFQYMEQLETLTMLNPVPVPLEADIVSVVEDYTDPIDPTWSTEGYNMYETVTLVVPEGSEADYMTAPIWNKFFNVVSTGVRENAADMMPASVEAVYSVDGVRRSSDAHGMMIQKMTDGTARKVLIRK